jgi:hypothetical protein
LQHHIYLPKGNSAISVGYFKSAGNSRDSLPSLVSKGAEDYKIIPRGKGELKIKIA